MGINGVYKDKMIIYHLYRVWFKSYFLANVRTFYHTFTKYKTIDLFIHFFFIFKVNTYNFFLWEQYKEYINNVIKNINKINSIKALMRAASNKQARNDAHMPHN